MKRTLAVVMLVVLMAPSVLAAAAGGEMGEAAAAPRAGEPWWDYSWNFRRAITVDNSGNSEALSDYQVLLNITYDSDMKPDFADLRFVQFNQTNGQHIVLAYYIEGKADGAYAGVWVKVNTTPAQGTATFFMYYGNPSAASASSAASTFEFFDDFSTDPSGRWTTMKGSVAWDSTNKWFSVTTTGWTNANDPLMTIASAMAPVQNMEIVLKLNLDSTASLHDGGPLGRMVDNQNGYGIVLQADNYFSIRIENAGVSTHLGYVVRPVTKQSWTWVKFQLFGTNLRGRYWTVGAAEPQTWDFSIQDSNYTGKGRAGFQQIRGGPTRFDDFQVRRYTSPEPSCSAGAEERPFKFKSMTFSPARMNIGDSVFFNATFNNPTNESIKVQLAAGEADEFKNITDYFYQEQVTLAPSADTTIPYIWTAVGGQHTIWLAVAGYPFASAKIKVNRDPVIAPVKDQTLWQDRDFFLQVNASDQDGDYLTWSIDNALFNISSVSNRSAEISFLPTNDDVGVHRANISVRDPMNRTDTRRINFTVNNVNDPPELAKIPSLSATQYKELRYKATATDPDIKWGDVLTFGDNTDLFEIDAKTGEFYFTPVEEQVGKHNVKVWVTDAVGVTDVCAFTITVVNVNDPPTLEILPPQFALQGKLFQLKIVANDPDLKSDPTEKLVYSDDSPLFVIGADSGLISFTPTNDQIGVWIANITVTDRGGLSNISSLTITVMNANDPPSIEAIPPQTATEGVQFNYQVSATDPDLKWGLDNLTFLDDTDLFNIDPRTGAISFTPTGAQAGIKRVTITVKDDKGASAQASFDLTVAHVNHAPYDVAIKNPAEGTWFKQDEPMYLEATAKDSDKGDVLQFNWWENGNPLGTGRNISVKLSPGTHLIALEVTDGSESVSREVTVNVAQNKPVTVAGGGTGWLPIAAAAAAAFAIVAVVAVLAMGRKKRYQEPEPHGIRRIETIPGGEGVALPTLPPPESGTGEEAGGPGDEARAIIDSTVDMLSDYQEAHPEEALDVSDVMEKLDVARQYLKNGEDAKAQKFARKAQEAAGNIIVPPPPKRVVVKKKTVSR
jgi:hypothetical protein